MVYEYAVLFTTCEDIEFVKRLIRKLSINQGQAIRKAAPRIGEKKEIWEHAIPTKVIVEEIITMVLKKDLNDLKRLLEVYQCAGQRGLTKEQNKLLDKYRTSMPSGWDWRLNTSDPLARHTAVGIVHGNGEIKKSKRK